MRIKLITGQSREWDLFVEQSNNGTIFHKLRFLSYHPKKRFAFHNLMFMKNNKITAVVPGELKDGVFRSPAGASYGSFVTNNLTFSEHEEIVDAFLSYLRKRRCKKIILTPPPIFYYKNINEYERFIFAYKKFSVMHLITSSVNLEQIPYEHPLIQTLPKRFAVNVKKSYKRDLKIEFSSNYRDFYPILLDNKKKFKLLPTHSLDEIVRLSELFPNDIKLLMAYDENQKPIAGLFLIAVTKEILLAFYISHYYQYQKKRAINRLLFEATSWAKKNNFKWFDLGVSMETSSDNPMEPRRSLILFKEGLNTVGFLRSTYEITL